MPNADQLFQQTGAALAASSPAGEIVTKLVHEAKNLMDSIASLEEMLKSANGRLHEIKTQALPEALAQVGSSVWSKPDGTVTVEVKPFVAGTLPKPEHKEERDRAIKLLEEYGAGEIIKTEVSLSFGKSQHNMALDTIGRLRQEGLEPVVSSGVHPQTLLSFVRERLKSGEEVDVAGLGLFQGRQAKITFAAEKKPRKVKEK